MAIESGEVVVAKEATQKATKLIDKAVIHGLIHKNNGRNKVSGLMTRLYQLEKQS